VLNKIDVLGGEKEAAKHPQSKKLVAHLKKKKVPVLFMSGATGDGLDDVVRALAKAVHEARAADAAPPPAATGTFSPTSKSR
jgi:50S ribosomal subunit-associated GTPase HflX